MKYDCIQTLHEAGISYGDAQDLRRISMTLHRWHELECGDSNNHASWCITRGRWECANQPIPGSHSPNVFVHDGDGGPALERHSHSGSAPTYTAIPDRERGALKRLAKIMVRYPGFASYVQGDPRGAALYILTPHNLQFIASRGSTVDASYSCGIVVCK